MSDSSTFLDALAAALIDGGRYNRLDQIAPAALLWPDLRREWEPLIPQLRERLPMLTLGVYAPEQGSGPAAWLRCIVARALPESPAEDVTPVLYLPGVAMRALRGQQVCPKLLEPLIELQYRGAIWTQPDGRDWTVAAFLESTAVGLGIELRHDEKTREAMLGALPSLAEVPVARLRDEAPWRASDFEALLRPPSEERELSILDLIARGESGELEFKSTTWWNVRAGQNDPKMAQVIVKTVAAFLNSPTGGTLLIGVRDNGTIHGLDDDYQVFQRERRNRDQYELRLMGLLLGAFGNGFGPFIHVSFHDVDGHELCKVVIDPAPEPAYFEEEKREVFYVRMGNQSQPFSFSEAVTYIRRRWPDHG